MVIHKTDLDIRTILWTGTGRRGRGRGTRNCHVLRIDSRRSGNHALRLMERRIGWAVNGICMNWIRCSGRAWSAGRQTKTFDLNYRFTNHEQYICKAVPAMALIGFGHNFWEQCVTLFCGGGAPGMTVAEPVGIDCRVPPGTTGSNTGGGGGTNSSPPSGSQGTDIALMGMQIEGSQQPPLAPGEVVRWHAVGKNQGPITAVNARFNAKYSSHLTYISVGWADTPCTPSPTQANTVVCSGPAALPVGSEFDRFFAFKATDDAPCGNMEYIEVTALSDTVEDPVENHKRRIDIPTVSCGNTPSTAPDFNYPPPVSGCMLLPDHAPENHWYECRVDPDCELPELFCQVYPSANGFGGLVESVVDTVQSAAGAVWNGISGFFIGLFGGGSGGSGGSGQSAPVNMSINMTTTTLVVNAVNTANDPQMGKVRYTVTVTNKGSTTMRSQKVYVQVDTKSREPYTIHSVRSLGAKYVPQESDPSCKFASLLYGVPDYRDKLECDTGDLDPGKSRTFEITYQAYLWGEGNTGLLCKSGTSRPLYANAHLRSYPPFTPVAYAPDVKVNCSIPSARLTVAPMSATLGTGGGTASYNVTVTNTDTRFGGFFGLHPVGDPQPTNRPRVEFIPEGSTPCYARNVCYSMTCSTEQMKLTCPVGILAPGESTTMRFNMKYPQCPSTAAFAHSIKWVLAWHGTPFTAADPGNPSLQATRVQETSVMTMQCTSP